jgi:hypothetical protein
MKPKHSCEKGKATEFGASTVSPKNRLTPKRTWLDAIKLIDRSRQSLDIDFQKGKRQAVTRASGGADPVVPPWQNGSARREIRMKTSDQFKFVAFNLDRQSMLDGAD